MSDDTKHEKSNVQWAGLAKNRYEELKSGKIKAILWEEMKDEYDLSTMKSRSNPYVKQLKSK